jgi:DNA-binding MarR family transcriptional regulator
MTEAFHELQDGVAPATVRLRELMSTSTEVTGGLARQAGMHPTDAQALYLLESEGPLGVADLARRLGIRGASATVLVDRLERAGHAERRRDPEDRRRVWVSATPAAAEALVPVWAPVVLAIDAVARDLGPADRAAVEDYLARVAVAMTAAAAPATTPAPGDGAGTAAAG